MHVHCGLLADPGQEAWLWEDGDTGLLLLPAAKLAFRMCVGVLACSTRWLLLAAVRCRGWT